MSENGFDGLRALVERVGRAMEEGEPRGHAALHELEVELVGELAGIPPDEAGNEEVHRGLAALASLRSAIAAEARLDEPAAGSGSPAEEPVPAPGPPKSGPSEEVSAELPEEVGRARLEAVDAISVALNRFEETTGWLVAEIVVENIDRRQRKIYMKIGKPPE